MRVAILITLAYESISYEDANFIWEAIREKMLEAGFQYYSRLFVIDVSFVNQAYDLARATIEGIEHHLPFEERHLPRYLKDFYGFKLEDAVNLSLPCAETIKVG